jgi:XTP/dITP diphosphohydrolase
MQKLLVATHNQGKVVELAALLADLNIACLSLNDAGVTVDLPETGETFAANAILKATGYARLTGWLTLADDSGLQVDALDGRPGILTARYGGEGLTAAERYQLLLAEMHDVPWPRRTARFRAILALASPTGEILGTAEGVCEGVIAFAAAGAGGFGYDPIFYLPDRGLTMAQLVKAEKQQISHRARAIRAITPLLRQTLGG